MTELLKNIDMRGRAEEDARDAVFLMEVYGIRYNRDEAIRRIIDTLPTPKKKNAEEKDAEEDFESLTVNTAEAVFDLITRAIAEDNMTTAEALEDAMTADGHRTPACPADSMTTYEQHFRGDDIDTEDEMTDDVLFDKFKTFHRPAAGPCRITMVTSIGRITYEQPARPYDPAAYC